MTEGAMTEGAMTEGAMTKAGNDRGGNDRAGSDRGGLLIRLATSAGSAAPRITSERRFGGRNVVSPV